MATTDFDVASWVNKKVFWFEVAMHDVERLEIFERQDHLTGVDLRLELAAAPDSPVDLHTHQIY